MYHCWLLCFGVVCCLEWLYFVALASLQLAVQNALPCLWAQVLVPILPAYFLSLERVSLSCPGCRTSRLFSAPTFQKLQACALGPSFISKILKAITISVFKHPIVNSPESSRLEAQSCVRFEMWKTHLHPQARHHLPVFGSHAWPRCLQVSIYQLHQRYFYTILLPFFVCVWKRKRNKGERSSSFPLHGCNLKQKNMVA